MNILLLTICFLLISLLCRYTFHLFSDILIYSSVIPAVKKLKLHNVLDLAQSSIQLVSQSNAVEFGVPSEYTKCAMNFLSNNKTFVIYADTEESCHGWFEKISATINKVRYIVHISTRMDVYITLSSHYYTDI